jgi:uncharacterized protein YjiS (DUF1127 family)
LRVAVGHFRIGGIGASRIFGLQHQLHRDQFLKLYRDQCFIEPIFASVHCDCINPIERSNDWRREMSETLSTTVPPARTISPGTYLRIFNACWEGIARYFFRRAAIASLGELDDRALKDIGLTRSQSEAAVHGLTTAPNRART